MKAVMHHYEGPVSQIMGDGIMVAASLVLCVMRNR